MYEKGINSLQILAFLKSASHVTLNPKYDKAYNFLVREHHYLDNMLVQKMYGPYEVNHSDDELSFLPYYTLLRYGKDSPDNEVYSKSLARSWKAEEADRIPIWNYIATNSYLIRLLHGTCTQCASNSIMIVSLLSIPFFSITWIQSSAS